MSLPPILQQLQASSAGGLSGNLAQVRNMLNMVRNAGNPNAMLTQMIQNNPQLRSVMDMVQQSGGDPKKAFYDLAKQRGVDPNEILNMLK